MEVPPKQILLQRQFHIHRSLDQFFLHQQGDISAYEAQFFGETLTNFNKMVWKAWVTPKVKFFFLWLAICNRIWMADRLERRGWDNWSLCPLYNQTQESAVHLFSHCRYTKGLSNLAKGWLGIANIQSQDGDPELTIDEWCTIMACSPMPNRKAISPLMMLVSWTI
jgi:hypothetical protein